uniref:Centrosomal protein 72 n=1 Tax=Neolamprologus brichardi TaxID=32507 RepID=A0A3Q4MUP7_NEOBR
KTGDGITLNTKTACSYADIGQYCIRVCILTVPLVCSQGVQHLKMLQRLILYYNCIPSLEEVKVLFKLPLLKELDLRLNPLVKNNPQYRLYLVHAMPTLRKLDSCSVRDAERKSALMQFSSELLPQQMSFSLNLIDDRSLRHSSSFINIRPPSPRRPGLNLSDPFNPILHPPRLTYSSFNKTDGSSSQPGSYRKPLEMLLNLVDKHWTGERSLHQNNNFLSQAVQILSMMESDISSRETEVRTLRREADALRFQAAAREEEHKTEVHNLSAQLEEARRAGKLNEQLRVVLEENVALQKQLIKLERQYLKSMMKSSHVSQIRGGCTCHCDISERAAFPTKCPSLSLVATNECLLAELKGSGEH